MTKFKYVVDGVEYTRSRAQFDDYQSTSQGAITLSSGGQTRFVTSPPMAVAFWIVSACWFADWLWLVPWQLLRQPCCTWKIACHTSLWL